MIAADTSAWIDFSKGVDSKHAKALQAALEQGSLVIPLVVLVEILSGPGISHQVESLILAMPRLELTPGYWERTARMRRSLLKTEKKARLGDCLIAQSCIDQEVPLIAEDQDFRHFTTFGLRLI
ncbi:MAG: PIN domain-containing protein [Thermoguttaceae bacterium]|jgi:predicted nucleic acid-binding protein